MTTYVCTDSGIEFLVKPSEDYKKGHHNGIADALRVIKSELDTNEWEDWQQYQILEKVLQKLAELMGKS